jgi:hypothetical protein
MHVKIQVEVIEQKDGSFVVKLNGTEVGELNNIDPIDELEIIYTLTELLYESNRTDKSRKDLIKEIQERLAKLLAWYSTE